MKVVLDTNIFISALVTPDGSDNLILECAIAAGAELVVTGDRAMLELGEYEGVRLISLRDYLAIEERR